MPLALRTAAFFGADLDRFGDELVGARGVVLRRAPPARAAAARRSNPAARRADRLEMRLRVRQIAARERDLRRPPCAPRGSLGCSCSRRSSVASAAARSPVLHSSCASVSSSAARLGAASRAPSSSTSCARPPGRRHARRTPPRAAQDRESAGLRRDQRVDLRTRRRRALRCRDGALDEHGRSAARRPVSPPRRSSSAAFAGDPACR